jgi:DNA polymerase III epsilon subunit-like protein
LPAAHSCGGVFFKKAFMRLSHVMLDKETLGTSADAVIMSIGAVRFDLDGDTIDDDGFYASVSLESNIAAGRKLDESTLMWWLKQSTEAQAVFYEQKQSLESALHGFVDWFGDAKFIWSNGASFDIPMMTHALRSFHMRPPWEFYNERCVRTYKNLPGFKDVKVANALKHNALHDAVAQAQLVQAIQKKLTATHSMVKAKAS